MRMNWGERLEPGGQGGHCANLAQEWGGMDLGALGQTRYGSGREHLAAAEPVPGLDLSGLSSVWERRYTLPIRHLGLHQHLAVYRAFAHAH